MSPNHNVIKGLSCYHKEAILTSIHSIFELRNKEIRKIMATHFFIAQGNVVLFVLRFYGPVNPMGSCQARSVYLTTHLLGRLSPLSS